MRSRIAIFALAFACVAVYLITAGMAHGQGKFRNEDTAKDRKDSVWGTRVNEGRSYFGTNEDEDSVWGYQPAEPEEPVDWYDKIVITVDPDVSWPPGGESTTTTQTSSTNTVGGETNTTSSTTTTTAPNP